MHDVSTDSVGQLGPVEPKNLNLAIKATSCVTSSGHHVNLKENNFEHIVCVLSFTVTALCSRSYSYQKPPCPGRRQPKLISQVDVVLNLWYPFRTCWSGHKALCVHISFPDHYTGAYTFFFT